MSNSGAPLLREIAEAIYSIKSETGRRSGRLNLFDFSLEELMFTRSWPYREKTRFPKWTPHLKIRG